MNYTFYIVIFCSIVALIVVPIWFKHRLQFDFFSKTIQKKIALLNTPFFSSYVISEIVKIALYKNNKKIINLLIDENISKASKLLMKYNPFYAILLNGFTNPNLAIKKISALLKKNPNNSIYAAWLALLYNAVGDKSKSQSSWDNVKYKNLPLYLKGQHQAYIAHCALKNGDLDFASNLFYQAADLFNRSLAFYEEANIYLYIGTVYRISFLGDIAETLFLSALKSYRSLNFDEGIAKAFANLGILMIGQERFDEADDYLNKSLDITKKIKQSIALAEIHNQLSLSYLLQKNYSLAQKHLKTAKRIHDENHNIQGVAFSTDLEANIYWQQQNFKKAAKYAANAATLYEKISNISAQLDCKYLHAQSLFKLGDDKSSEVVLREIISIGKQDCGCFYLANTYNLLGIIFMKRQDYYRAKGLFQQSLDLEQRGVRLNALAVDYANIGIAEMSRGFNDEAKKNLLIALDFAKQIEDENLSQQIQSLLTQINN